MKGGEKNVYSICSRQGIPPIILINRMMRGYPYREGMDIPIEELIGCADSPALSTEDR